MKKSQLHKAFKRVICIFLILIFGFSFFSMIFSAVVFRVLFGRNDSVSGYVEIPYSVLKDEFDGRKEISFLSGENRLSGYLYGKGDKGIVIIAPGVNSSSERHLAEVNFFADNGYTVFTYDPTGVCESEGSGTVGLQQSKLDLLAAIDFVRGNSELKLLPIIVYGHSLGGYAAASVADNENVCAVISLSGFNSPVETMHGMAKQYVGIFADIQYPFLLLQNFFVFGENANPTAVDAVNSSTTPILICYGGGDTVIPYDLSLYSHFDELTNPNASCVYIDEPYRNGHSNVWLSGDSARYLDELQGELSDLSEAYEGDIPQSVLDQFYSEIDAEKATELDESFMSALLDFCNESVGR